MTTNRAVGSRPTESKGQGVTTNGHAGGSSTVPASSSPYESPRRPRAERAHAFHPLAWLADGASGVVEELRHTDLGLPQEFWRHAYAARRETILAACALANHLLGWGEQRKQAEQTRRKQRARRGDIQIDF